MGEMRNNNPACEFCVDCNRYGHTAEWCPGTTTQPDPEKMKMLQAWEASNPEFHCTKPGETEADDLLLDVHLCAFKSGYTARPQEPTDADLEKLGNRAMEFLVAKYGQPQSGAFVNWQARPEEIALEMAEFVYRVQSQPVAEQFMRPAVRELLCQYCNQEYPVWFAPNDLWNAVQQKGEHFLCLTCFANLAEQRGIKTTGWKLITETEADGDLSHQIFELKEQTADLRNRLEAYEWRRVEEELPIEDGEYLAAIKSPSWSELIYAVIEWKDSNWIRHSNVVAWMPVPPFKELQEATKDE
jgi:hypothetical protein